MKCILTHLQNRVATFDFLFLVANLTVILCTIVVLFAILIDFVRYHQPKANKKKINSWVETGTMLLYFFGYYLLLQFQPGRYFVESRIWMDLWLLLGTLLVIAGCYVNVKGRLVLKDNWANQVTLYHHQTLVVKSVYGLVRHPLYASLIWMLTGGALIYSNYLALASVLSVFMPMMYYRAKQEENLLVTEFPQYAIYKQQVGMFLPNILKHGKL